jgi:hypothetical protein
MILDQVLRRKMSVVSLDDTLQVAARKLRALDEIESPILTSVEERELDDTVQIIQYDESPKLRLEDRPQAPIPVVFPLRLGAEH